MSDHWVSTPDEILELITGYWRSAIVRTAVDLRIFDHLADGRDSPEAVAAAEGSDVRSTRRLLDALCALGLADKNRGHYLVAPLSAHFLTRRPGSLADLTDLWVNEVFWQAWGNLTEAVRTGKPVAVLHADHSFWQGTFAEASFGLAYRSGQRVLPLLNLSTGREATILDVGCGSGGFGFAIAIENPSTKVVSLDSAGVLSIARKNAARLGILDRITLREADVLTTAGLGDQEFDVAIVSNLLHLFAPDDNEVLMARVFAALSPGGQIVIADYLADEERRRSDLALVFALLQTLTSFGGTYTFSEINDWLTIAGFEKVERHDMAGAYTVLVASRPGI